MKNFLVFGVLLFIVACSSSTSVSRSTQSELKGNWTVTDVSYPGSDVIKITSFGIADSQCMKGSVWNFISNNNKGRLELTQDECPAYSTAIVWSINKENTFALKLVTPGTKAKKITQGYNLKYVSQTETSFQLIDKVNIGGRLTNVVYQFQKNNE